MGAPNGNTIAWRVTSLEARVDEKADKDDMQRLEAGFEKLSGRIDKLIVAAVSATVSGAVAAILLAVQLTSA